MRKAGIGDGSCLGICHHCHMTRVWHCLGTALELLGAALALLQHDLITALEGPSTEDKKCKIAVGWYSIFV